jgi:hypothetical protein
MLVRADDRPAALGEEEDYIPDLVGMDVIVEVRFFIVFTGQDFCFIPGIGCM